jgi:hypothetical protein
MQTIDAAIAPSGYVCLYATEALTAWSTMLVACVPPVDAREEALFCSLLE